MGPATQSGEHMHRTKYRLPGESFRDAMNRIAATIAPDQFKEFREILLGMAFMPAGRVQAAVGAPKKVTAYNCFVSGRIEDSFTDGPGSIMQRAHEAATTMRMGGGIGYDFSTLRPRGDRIRKLGSISSGPVSFMDIFDAICKCVSSAGHRRGAQMGVMRIDHPDIEEFLAAKRVQGRLTGFNVSIAVTDEFMRALETGSSFPLRFQGREYGEVDSVVLWDKVMRSTWDWAEPGVLFIDTINRMNNLRYCEEIYATNPCGEQPLPPYGACLLGSFNLTKYLSGNEIDIDRLIHDIPIVVEAMDNVIDSTIYPLPEQEVEAKSKRRMGLGVTGLANALEVEGYPYGSPEFLVREDWILKLIANECYKASSALAFRKGSFPMFRKDYLEAPFIRSLDPEVQNMIEVNGIRNSHLTSIAPTGTISFCADNVSSGIEPVFSHKYSRTVIEENGPVVLDMEDYGVKFLGFKGKTAKEVTVKEHLGVLLTAARRVDSAVSKTLNVPGTTPWEEFKSIYVDAWRGGAKGCTTFRMDGKREGVLVEACQIDPETGKRDCDVV